MQSFIVEHYLNKKVDVYCGGPDVFRGIIEACAENSKFLYSLNSGDRTIAVFRVNQDDSLIPVVTVLAPTGANGLAAC